MIKKIFIYIISFIILTQFISSFVFDSIKLKSEALSPYIDRDAYILYHPYTKVKFLNTILLKLNPLFKGSYIFISPNYKKDFSFYKDLISLFSFNFISKYNKEEAPILRQIIAKEGEIVIFDNDNVFIKKGNLIISNFKRKKPALFKDKTFILQKAEYFVLAFNDFLDSYTFNIIKEDEIIGKAFLQYYPLQKFQFFK